MRQQQQTQKSRKTQAKLRAPRPPLTRAMGNVADVVTCSRKRGQGNQHHQARAYVCVQATVVVGEGSGPRVMRACYRLAPLRGRPPPRRAAGAMAGPQRPLTHSRGPRLGGAGGRAGRSSTEAQGQGSGHWPRAARLPGAFHPSTAAPALAGLRNPTKVCVLLL